MSKTFALVDCNNFYASCEKLFRPDLKHVPVVCLSNNDGCIVSRSAEAKALGFKMATPYFQVKDKIRRHGVQVFSSNYALYANLSQRVMHSLEHLAPRVEVYSIDEAFLDLSGMQALASLTEFGQQLKQTVSQWTGIEVCVGIANTKTLAKLANHAAKRYPATGGVVDLSARQRQLRLLQLVPVGEVWGVGHKTATQLNAMGIATALDLARARPKILRQRFSVTLERTIAELNGESCLALEDIAAARQQIISSRSFGSKVTRLSQMRQAICDYTARVAEKLRQQQQAAMQITVFIRTGAQDCQYSNSASSRLAVASSDTRVLVQQAMQLLQQIWRDGYSYAKGGVMLADLRPADALQPDLFAAPQQQRASTALMQTIDAINNSGKGRIFLAGQGVQQEWSMRRQFLSPAYTTKWQDIPLVR